jgi:putative redox protein
MQASTTWVSDDRFMGVATSGHGVVVDASELKLGNSPMELALIALCGCTASDVTTILRKKREPLSLLEVRAVAERAAEPPRVFTTIHLLYRVNSGVSRKSMEDAIRLSKDKYCSVSQMLGKTAAITAEIEYVD